MHLEKSRITSIKKTFHPSIYLNNSRKHFLFSLVLASLQTDCFFIKQQIYILSLFLTITEEIEEFLWKLEPHVYFNK